MSQLKLSYNQLLCKNIFKIIFCIFIFPSSLYSQTANIDTSNPDSLFHIANKFAKDGKLIQCREICFSVIDKYPEYIDYIILAGRTLAWENKFDSAKTVVKPILDNKPHHKEALLTLADIEMWQMNLENALAHVDSGLVYLPEDTLLLEKRAEILSKIEHHIQKTTVSYGALHPDSNAVGVAYYFDFFKKPYIARRHMISCQYTKITNFAPLSVRLNIGNNILNGEHFFNENSYQLEIDAYPKLKDNSYLYLNYGVGRGSFFPAQRIGAEYFKGLNEGFGFSAGTRYMYWNESIFFLTGSISKYLASYWLAFRPFFLIKENHFSNAYLFETRRYFETHNSYLFGIIILGDSPDQPLSLAQEFGNFKSTKCIIGIQHRISQIQLNASFGLQKEEYLLNNSRIRTEYKIGINYVF